MTKDLLWRGMLAGILAAMLCTLFARAVAEPQVDRAIAFETAHEHGEMDREPEPVSRAVQKSFGLFTAMVLYGAALGGLFSLLFAFAYGRLARVGPRTLALGLALLAFVVVALVPALKYPPDPPAVGQPETIQMRTAVYFAMLAASLVTTAIAFRLRAALATRLRPFDATLGAVAAYVMIIAVVQVILPHIEEVPADFPAQVLWDFRIASFGIQGLLWLVIGTSFGWMAERVIRRSSHAV